MKIGRYEVEKELGQGGMAMVYLARDPYIKRQVAVKVLPRQFTFDPQFRARFQREAEVIAALEHPAIVPVYDFGEDEDQPFIVMRYMPGGSLADLLANGPLPIPEIAKLFERIGSALDHAHRQGIIHRDIKPGNILFDSQRLSYLSDFGISKITEATASLTGSGIIGTPAYMSPEQAQGEKNLDGRCDIYSLGVVLFQALTGELPYKANTPMGQAMAHITQPVPSLLERKPDLPPTFERIIRKTLDKSPDQRYQTASQLTDAIREGEQVPSLRITPAPRQSSLRPKLEPVPVQQADAAAKSKIAIPRLLAVSGAVLLFLCVALIGGLASGIIPNPFINLPVTGAFSQPTTSLSTEPPAVISASPTLIAVTDTLPPPDASPTAVIIPSRTPFLAPSPLPTQPAAVGLPLFTARTNMLCREGPGTEYPNPWQLTAGEVVPVLAKWYRDVNWLLVDINVPATQTRTDCCWVGGEGTLSVPLDQIKTINFMPNRLDCSAVK